MSFDEDYSADTEFSKLLIRTNDVDLTRVALELTRDAYPDIEFEDTLDWINARSNELAGSVAGAWSEADALGRISQVIGETHAIFGDESVYTLADSSFLPRVIETKRGIPISLSVLYMAVANSLGIELRGVATPMHFITRYDGAIETIFVDAFDRGRIMNETECLEWLESITGQPRQQLSEHLQPVDSRAVVTRMLNNLKVIYIRDEAWTKALKVQQRLSALQPASYAQRRDLGMIALKAKQIAQAIDILRTCLKSCPDEEAEVLNLRIEEAERQLAQWN
jgi:regulator of sirC expression with transglutaminase-like and TPR domain